ncbi:MAG: response regulator transcription factor [Coprobacillaceae bacterium]
MKKILIVEDNESYRINLESVLRNEGYEVNSVDNPISGIEMFAKSTYDLVISDLIMKEFDGIRFLTTIKNIDPKVNTMILTGNPDDDTEISSIDIHVDFYLSKSRALPVIVKYVKRLAEERNISNVSTDILVSKSEGISLSKKAHEVKKNGEKIDLTPKEYQILKLYLENKCITLSRQDIIDEIWGIPIEEIDERVIDLHIKHLRAKLKIISLITVRGYGYKWNE